LARVGPDIPQEDNRPRGASRLLKHLEGRGKSSSVVKKALAKKEEVVWEEGNLGGRRERLPRRKGDDGGIRGTSVRHRRDQSLKKNVCKDKKAQHSWGESWWGDQKRTEKG